MNPHKQRLREQKADFAKNGIPPEFNQHIWKKGVGVIVCKKCGLIKGSGFSKCERLEPETKHT